MRNILSLSLTFFMALIASYSASASDVDDRLKQIEREIEKIRSQTGSESSSSLDVYGTLRPVLTWEDDETDSALDVRDALSRFGFAGSTALKNGGTAYFTGEWKIQLQDGGNIDGTRKALVGLKGSYGDVAIGTQRPPQYSLIAEHVDIFNHGNSPYAYDAISPFFVDNMLVYKKQFNQLEFQAAMQSNGAEGEDVRDLVNTGLSFKQGAFYVAAAYLKSTQPQAADQKEPGAENETIGGTVYFDQDGLYIAAAYQAITVTPEVGSDIDVTTTDVSLAYQLPSAYKVKAGGFVYDDGVDGAASGAFSGANLTLERQLSDNVRVHGEYLFKDFDEADTVNAVTVGIRYDFSAAL